MYSTHSPDWKQLPAKQAGFSTKKIRAKADFFGPLEKSRPKKPDLSRFYWGKTGYFFLLSQKGHGNYSQKPDAGQRTTEHQDSFSNTADFILHLRFRTCINISLHRDTSQILIFPFGYIISWNYRDYRKLNRHSPLPHCSKISIKHKKNLGPLIKSSLN